MKLSEAWAAVTTRTRPTRIVAAAVTVGDLVVSVPRPGRHGDVLHPLAKLGVHVGPDEQGFLADNGEFYGRVTARTIALEAGQITGKTIHKDELFSEDLW